jgi:hypothetical protein
MVRASRLIRTFIGVIRRPEKREEGATLRMRAAHLLAMLGGIFGCFVVKGSSWYRGCLYIVGVCNVGRQQIIENEAVRR